MLIGTYGYELRRPIAEALRIIQDYINSEILTIDCTVDDYSSWQSNLRIIDSYYYIITNGLPRHISEEHTLYICNVIPRIYYNNLNPECVVTSNEFRQVLGLKPSDDPDADALRNKNLNRSENEDISEIGENKSSPTQEELDAYTNYTINDEDSIDEGS